MNDRVAMGVLIRRPPRETSPRRWTVPVDLLRRLRTGGAGRSLPLSSVALPHQELAAAAVELLLTEGAARPTRSHCEGDRLYGSGSRSHLRAVGIISGPEAAALVTSSRVLDAGEVAPSCSTSQRDVVAGVVKST